MKVRMHREDIEKILAVLEAINHRYDEPFELEVDIQSGIGTTGTLHVPTAINSLPGTFSYEIWGVESW